MRLKYALFVIILGPLAISCSDEAVLTSGLDDDGIVSASKRGEVKMIPLKGTSTFEWDGSFLAPSERCANVGGVAEVLYLGVGEFTHLGRLNTQVSQCFNFASSPPLVYSVSLYTSANGDQLVTFTDGTPMAEIPDGSVWGYEIIIESGTGRFEGATGGGNEHGTLEFDPPGGGGVFYIDAVVSAVGTIQ